jgi:hypothetical protein
LINPPKILIDATRDGGVWWFPQSSQTGFSPVDEHQGKKLADYLRYLGYQVDELGRGELITAGILNQYSYVIRAGGFGNYTPEELNAYESFLGKQSSLLLLTDHLSNFTNDQLSASLGLNFEGAYDDIVTSFQSHPVTAGVTSFPFMVGSVIRNYNPTFVSVTGTMQISLNGENRDAGVMGTVTHGVSKIFFIGDVNGLETVPQPFTSNLVSWLFK